MCPLSTPPVSPPLKVVYVVRLKLEDKVGRGGKLVAPRPAPTPRTLSVVRVPEVRIFKGVRCVSEEVVIKKLVAGPVGPAPTSQRQIGSVGAASGSPQNSGPQDPGSTTQ